MPGNINVSMLINKQKCEEQLVFGTKILEEFLEWLLRIPYAIHV